MPTSTSSFKINGVINTNDSVLSNLEKITSSACAWLTYDINQGKWAIVINKDEGSIGIVTFDDTNIIGGINISSTGLTDLYNSVEIEFPHADIKDRKDYITFEIDSSERYPNEPDNVLKITTDLVNDPMQAAAIAMRELKQSRVDKVIEFRTDYSYIGLKAGDVIGVTNDALNFAGKMFRIIKVSEEDTDEGTFNLSITALEYDANVYNTDGLIRTDRSVSNGIVAKTNNNVIKDIEDQSWTEVFGRMLLSSAVTGLINSVFTRNPATGKITQLLTPKNTQRENDILEVFDNGDTAKALKGLKTPGVTITGPSAICEGETLTLTLALDCSSCLFDSMSYNYTITGVQTADITPFPLTGTVTVPGTMSIPIANDGSAETETLTVTIGTATKEVTINDRLAFTYVTTASPTSITEGASSTVTLSTTGISNGTSVPYTITGAGTGRVTTALTGNVTVSGNSATLTVNTTDDSTYTGDQSVTVTFNPSQADPCGQLDKTAAISILDNDPAPVVCPTVTVPVVWCATYNGTTGNVTGLTAVAYATVAAAYSGGPSTTVPLTVSVSSGNPSTVTVLTTATIDASANKSGQDFNVITTFNTIAPNAVPTGTTTTVRGY
jgi:hypothetical protein